MQEFSRWTRKVIPDSCNAWIKKYSRDYLFAHLEKIGDKRVVL